MSPSTLTQILLGSLLDNPAIVEVASQAGGTVLSVLREHFTFTASEITKVYQEGCGYAFVAISVGLDAPDSLLKTLRYPKITREFAAQIETHYWQPFVQINEAVQKQADFRKLTIQSLKKYAKKTDKLFEIKALTEEDLSALVSHRQNLAITDVVLEQMQSVETVDEQLAAFLGFDGLLGDSVLFFFRELIRKDPRLKDTQNALQQEHICLELEQQSDLFAFGKTLYRLLTGELPLEIEPEPLAKAPQWYTLLSHCTRQNPAKRPKSAKEVITLLEALKPNKPASTQKSDGIAEDDKAWQTACEHNTLEAYQAYLKGNTLKRHLEKAKACLHALEKDKQTQLRREAERKDKAAQREDAERQKTTEKFFQFEVVTIRLEGGFLGFGQKIIKNTKRHEARYQTEDLGNGVMLEMVYIPGGTFMMGSPKNEGSDFEKPQHEVTVKPFLMGKYPITQAQWIAVMDKNPSHFKGDNRPVEMVSWHECVEFCKRLFEKTGKAYRLPSESEWEYACRAGTTTPFYFGETITPDLANYNGRYTYASGPKGVYRGETTDVGSFPPNVFGLYDMHGNVWEWCADLWHDNYDGAPTDGSAWLENKSDKANLDYFINSNDTNSNLLRSGSFLDFPFGCRAALRGRNSSVVRFRYWGFRGCADLIL